MTLRSLSRSSLILLLMCVLVLAQKPVRLLLQGFAATIVETVEKADAATPIQIGAVAPPVMPAPPVLHDAPVHVDCVVTVHSTPFSVLRI